jgi:hypothetical protein
MWAHSCCFLWVVVVDSMDYGSAEAGCALTPLDV